MGEAERRLRTDGAVQRTAGVRAAWGVPACRVQALPLTEATACGRCTPDLGQAPSRLPLCGLFRRTRASSRASRPSRAARSVALVLLGLSSLHGICSQEAGGQSRAEGDLSAHFAAPNWTMYHSGEELLREVRALAARHPWSMEMEEATLRRGHYAATLTAVHVRLGRWPRSQRQKPFLARPLPGNTSPRAHKAKQRALLVFGQHGREAVSPEIGLRLLQLLAGEDVGARAGQAAEAARGAAWGLVTKASGSASGPEGGSATQASGSPGPGGSASGLTHLLAGLPPTLVTVVPMENVHGRRLVESGAVCDRKNGRGVDLNRNWAVNWGHKEKDYDPREEYPGMGPFSEPEAELMRRLCVRLRPQLWVNVHSGMEALFVPFDHRAGGVHPRQLAAMQRVAADVNTRFCGGRCTLGAGGGSVGYYAHGTATDWVYGALRTPLAFTFEVYGNERAHRDDCFRSFNPTDETTLGEVVSTWAQALVHTLLLLPQELPRLPQGPLPLGPLEASAAPADSRASAAWQHSTGIGSYAILTILVLLGFWFLGPLLLGLLKKQRPSHLPPEPVVRAQKLHYQKSV